MIRTASRLLLIGIMLMSVVGAVSAAPVNQSGAFLPAVLDFTTDAGSVSYADVEAGSAQVTLSWHTMNTNGQYRVVLEAYQRDTWVPLTSSSQALPLNGSKEVQVALPENFGPPTYRLTLKTSQGAVIEQRFVTLNYTPVDDAPAPSIGSFATTTRSVDTNLLVQNNARLNVQWTVANRRPDTLIRLDQVLPDGSVVSAEGPRHSLWLPSQGLGTLIPRSTSSRADLQFRLSLVNAFDGTVYDQQEITLPVIGQILVAAPQNNTTMARNGGINAFAAQATNGGDLIVQWDASGADKVQLLQTSGGDEGAKTLYIELPPSGSMIVPAPEQSGTTFELRAQSADGSVATGEVTVGDGQNGG